MVEVDGHNVEALINAFDEAASTKGKPSILIANTTKGKGASFAEDIAGWHGKAPNYEQMLEGLKQLGLENYFDLDKLFKKVDRWQQKVRILLQDGSKRVLRLSVLLHRLP